MLHITLTCAAETYSGLAFVCASAYNIENQTFLTFTGTLTQVIRGKQPESSPVEHPSIAPWRDYATQERDESNAAVVQTSPTILRATHFVSQESPITPRFVVLDIVVVVNYGDAIVFSLATLIVMVRLPRCALTNSLLTISVATKIAVHIGPS